MTFETIAPHGGVLIDRLVPAAEAEAFVEAASRLPSLTLATRQLCDLELIAAGALSPLDGFMTERAYRSVVHDLHLPSGLAWTVPVTLPVDEGVARTLSIGADVALRDAAGAVAGLLTVSEIYRYDREVEAREVYGTTDLAHPGVAALLRQPSTLVAGPIRALPRPHDPIYDGYYLYPREVRARFAERGWRTIVGFQTRNPVHRAHEYIQKAALEVVDGLLLHPLIGETKSDDIPAEVRLRCYEILLEHYYPRERVLLAVLPASMRYAGPREAIFHAIMRQNYGCSHFIVGRDHAGVGNYYGTYDAQKLFDRFSRDELAIQPLKFEHTFYCRRCESMASPKTCPHGAEHHVILSGTKVRELLAAGEAPPPEYSRPEVAAVLVSAAR
jgi:sulfate adenylyltransferase